ncbi:alpha/beta fold hydrolase [Lichenihabitans sp. PAMC28606]|uniref:alpha/beta hydrolase n=1 Tax=Lichenihabitans sp. PAMC28606 TaxID=2880932 RepID=UPI001D0BA15F|nr:alpha/beta hydrolase [Lichenihabitans sp. PAMC28606]UDL95642.1 alpha/beta fold hydrolase [Lichenihabitans sp. PAMC28606]
MQQGLCIIRKAALAVYLLVCWRAAARAGDDMPPGQLVSVGDAMLHVSCVGAGTPAVVFEAGLGGNSFDWTFVQARLAATHRACTYDRPGAGWSSRTAQPRDAATMAEELHGAMQKAGVPTPFILVGHSFGGLLSQNYLARFPADVAGLVLVDSMHPQQFERFTDGGVDVPVDPHAVLGHTPAFAATYGLPRSLWPLATRLAGADKARVFIVREMTAMLDIAKAVDGEARPSRPTRILVHGNRDWDQVYPDGRMEALWRAMQDDLATRFGAPPVTVVADSGHQIALDDPAAVVAAVEDVARDVARSP